VSQVHAVIIVPLSLYILATETKERGQDRAFGWAEEVGFVHAIAAGYVGASILIFWFLAVTDYRYFLWDSLDAIINFTDLGFVIHGMFRSTLFARLLNVSWIVYQVLRVS
jgi:hypothetical protein